VDCCSFLDYPPFGDRPARDIPCVRKPCRGCMAVELEITKTSEINRAISGRIILFYAVETKHQRNKKDPTDQPSRRLRNTDNGCVDRRHGLETTLPKLPVECDWFANQKSQ
jgi:hypothetical protein